MSAVLVTLSRAGCYIQCKAYMDTDHFYSVILLKQSLHETYILLLHENFLSDFQITTQSHVIFISENLKTEIYRTLTCPEGDCHLACCAF